MRCPPPRPSTTSSRRCWPIPRRAAVLLDIDGTLAPIVRHADDAHVPEPTRLPLIAIAKRYGLVACVSGRRATTARRIVSLGSITYVGNHGAEILRGGQTTAEVEPRIAAWARRVRSFGEGELRGEELHRLRVRGEDKDVIFGFHWRGAPDEEAAEEAARGVAARAEEAGFHTHWGRKILEVRPPVELNKGLGVAHLLSEADVDVALYAGDDRTDLDAFDALRAAVARGNAARGDLHRRALRRDAAGARGVRRPARRRAARRAHGARSAGGPLRSRMRFVDFLRSTVLLSAGAATTLGVLTLVAATRDQDDQVVLYRDRLVGRGDADRRPGWGGATRSTRRSRGCWPTPRRRR